MANGVFNIARGTLGYYYYAVENSLVVTAAAGANGPAFTSTANAALVVVLLETSGLESDDTLNGSKTLAEVLDGTTNEQTNQARKVLTDADIVGVPAFNDTTNQFDLDIPDITWTALAGNAISRLIICFRPDTASADTAIVPLTYHDFVVTPDGSDVTAQVAAAGFRRSS